MADLKKPREGGEVTPATIRMPASERWEPASDARPTTRMPSAAPPPGRPRSTPPRAPTPPRPSRPPRPASRGVELVVVEEQKLPRGERRPWRAAEIWTKRRVYGLDSTFRCVEVLDRESGRTETAHEMLGARLGGGRRREATEVRFSYPLPLPGMEAMFSKGKKHGYTSAVERVIVRVRVLGMSADEEPPTWEDIASRWSDPPPAPT